MSSPTPAAGTCRFMGVELLTAPGALVPREETELLGRTVVALLGQSAPAPRVIDMCTGSGNLACGVAKAVPGARVWASDLTEETVRLARANVAHLELEDRVHVAQGDLFGGLRDLSLEGTIDLVMCNPPYISVARLAGDRAHLLDNEPREAFDGGPYGISIHQRVIKDALDFLKPGGYLAFEFGDGQGRQLELLFKRAGAYAPVVLHDDASGSPRVAVARRI